MKLQQNLLIKKESNDYDKRLVNYEKIHQVKDEDFNVLNKLCNLQDNDVVMDYGAGYGSVTTELIKRNKGKKVNYVLLEPSKVQINRAEFYINNKSKNNELEFINAKLDETLLVKETYSHIISKVAIHEIPIVEQEMELKRMFDILKNNGAIFIWTIHCDDVLQSFVQSFFNKKDSLTNLTSLAKNRYFASNKELSTMLMNAGFLEDNISIHEINPMTYKTKNQLDQDFRGDYKRLEEFNEYIIDLVSRQTCTNKSILNCKQKGKSVTVHLPQYILKAIRK